MRAESSAELLLSYGVSFCTAKPKIFPPIEGCPLQLSRCIQHFFPVITLCNLKLPLNSMQTVIYMERVSGMFGNRWTSLQKLSPLVSNLRGCISISMVLHILSHLLQQLGLHHHQLLKGNRGWRQQILASLVVPPGVHHL